MSVPASGDVAPYAWAPVSNAAPPATMHPGTKTTIAVVVRNTGTEAWHADAPGVEHPMRLAPVSPRGRSSVFASADPTWLWSGGTHIRMTSPEVPPGGLGVFAFTFTAPVLPSYPQTFVERFAPIVEGIATLDSNFVQFTVTVRPLSSNVPTIPNPPLPEPSPVPTGVPTGVPTPTPAPTMPPLPTPSPTEPYAWSTLVTTAPPSSMHPGTKVALAVLLRNDGAQTWRADGPGVTNPVRLAPVAPRGRASAFASEDPTWMWSSGTRIRMETPVVPPSGIGLFLFTFTAPTLPAYPQTFVEGFAPVVEGVATLDERTIDISVTVRPSSSNLPPVPNPAVPTPPCNIDDPGSCSPVPLPTPTLPPLPCEPGPSCLPQPPPIPGGECSPQTPATYRDALPPAAAAVYTGFGTPVVFDGLAAPTAATPDPLGKIVIADTGNDRILRADPGGTTVFAWGGTGSDDGRFREPSGVAVSSTGRLYVADTGNDRIQVFSLGSTHLATFASTGSEPGMLRGPRGITVVPSGTFNGAIAVADTGNDRIQILGGDGTPLAVIGAGTLRGPEAVSVYRDEIYVADTGNDRVVRFTMQGQQTGSWGATGSDAGCMRAPRGVLANEHGLFVADTGNNRIQRYARFGPLLETFGTSGTAANQMRAPAGLMFINDGLWVVESGGHRLQRFTPPVSVSPPVPCGGDPFVCVPTGAMRVASACPPRRHVC